jgi:hypothetical protein
MCQQGFHFAPQFFVAVARCYVPGALGSEQSHDFLRTETSPSKRLKIFKLALRDA